MIRLTQYMLSSFPDQGLPRLYFYVLGSCLLGSSCGVADAKQEPFCLAEKVSLPKKNLFGTMKYKINPAFLSKVDADQQPLTAVSIERVYTSPKKRKDYIMLSPLRVKEVVKYAQLVKASQEHMGQYDDAFFLKKANGDIEGIKTIWSKKKEKEKKREWLCIIEKAKMVHGFR